jgi:hypothetical protein
MNRTITIVLAIFVAALTIVVAALVVREQNLPAAAQAALDKYIEYRYLPSQAPTIRQVARASLPWNFSSNMSGATFGDSVFFGTTHSYRVQPVNPPGFPTITPDPNAWRIVGGSPSGSGGRPVPFPPTDVWCVLLQDEIPSSATVVYIALHEDLYYADWVLHEPARSSKEITDALSRIGCDLKLGDEGTR